MSRSGNRNVQNVPAESGGGGGGNVDGEDINPHSVLISGDNDSNSLTVQDQTSNTIFNVNTNTGNTTINGDLTVNGTATFVETKNLDVTNSMISLNNGAPPGSNVRDIGFYGLYIPAATPLYTGFVKQASSGIYKLFNANPTVPNLTVSNIDSYLGDLSVKTLYSASIIDIANGLTTIVRGATANGNLVFTNSGTGSINFITDGAQKFGVNSANLAAAVPLALPSTGNSTATVLNFGTAGTGIFGGAAAINFAVANTEIFTILAASVTSTQPFLGPNGAAATPTFGFASDTSTGFYRSAASTIMFTCGNANKFSISNLIATSLVPVSLPLGAVGAPSLTNNSDSTTGVYFPSSTQIGLSIAGTNKFNIAAALCTFTTAITLPVGTATTPQIYFSDSQTGIYADSTDNIRFTVSGALKLSVLSTSILAAVQIVSIAGSAAATGINFGTAGTGLYGTASAVSISAGGTNVVTFNSSGVNGTVFNGAGTGLTGTAASLTAGTCTTIPNLTGMVTSVGNATTVVTNANLTGEATSVGNAVTLDNTAVISKTLTGFVAAAGTVTNADSILTAFNKVVGNIALAAGTVTSVSVVSANGFAGSVATATTTPAITISTSITGLLKGNGTSISAATEGTDYSAGTSALATGILKSTTGTGALSIAVAGDFPTLNQDTTGTAAKSNTQLVTNSSANSNFNVAFYSAGSGYGSLFVNAATLNFNPSQGRFTAPIIEGYDGSVSAPSHTFANSTNTGVYYEDPGRYNYTVAGTKFATMNDSGRFRFYPDSTKIEQQVLQPYPVSGADVGYASSISADGNTLVLGAPGSSTNGNAAIYTRSNGVWTLQQSLVSLATTLNTTTPSQFGYSSVLSADGTIAAIGAYGELTNTGAVYVFSRTNNTWAYIAKLSFSNNTGNTLTLTGNDTTTNSGLGGDCFLSANGTTLAIGAPLHNSNSGAVWVCSRNGSVFTQQAVIKSTAGGVVLTGLGTGGSNFGYSTQLSSDGNELIVGAPLDTSTGGAGTPNTGAVFLFVRATGGNTWAQQTIFRTTTAATNVVLLTGSIGAARLGEDVSISSNGNTAMIGGSGDNTNVGAVWILNNSDDNLTWTQLGSKLVPTQASSGSQFGFWATITGDGNDFAAGAPGYQSNAGAFFCYERNTDLNTWAQQGGAIQGSFIGGTSKFGSTITSSENFSVIVAGAPEFLVDQGAAGVFISQTCSIISPGGVFSGNFGSARQPTFNCDAGNRTSGLYFPNANSCALSADGISIAKFVSDTSNSGQIQMYSRGNVTRPSFSFMEESNTGIFLEGTAYTGRIGFSTLGARFCVMNDSGRMRFYNNNTKVQQTNPPIIPTTAAGSLSGTAVGISADGNTAIIGSPAATGGGNAFIYVRADTIWTEQANLRTVVAGTGTGASEFGTSVAISTDGDTAIVGSPGEVASLGACYVYVRSGTTWSFQAKIGLSTVQSCTLTLTLNTGASRLGAEVSASSNGSSIALSGPADATNRGGVWICTRTGTTWTQQIMLGSVTAAGRYGYTGFGTGITVTQFGYSTSLSASGNTLVVGGPRDGSNGTTGGTIDTGAVWIFQRATGATTWVQTVLVRFATAAAGVVLYTGNSGTAIRFGEDVGVSGDGTYAVIGASADNSNQGKVWAYLNTTGSTWVQQATLVPTGLSATAQFGYRLSISGDATDLIVGAPQNVVAATTVGALVSYELNLTNNTWSQVEAPSVPAGNTGACNMGSAIASNENAGAVIAGAPANNSNVGAAFVWIEQTASIVTPKGVFSGTLGSMKQPTFNCNTGGRNSGLYFPDLNSCALSADGTGVVRFTSNSAANTAQILAYNRGTVALPTYSWNENPNTGMYSSAADTVNLTTAGVVRLTLNTVATFSTNVTCASLNTAAISGSTGTFSGAVSATTVTASTAGSGVFILSGNSSAGTGYGTAIQNTGSMFASANELMRFGNTHISSVTPIIGAQLVRIAPSTTANFRIADSVAMSGDGSFIFAGAPGTGSTVTAFYIYQIVKTGSVVGVSQTITAQPTGSTGAAGAIRLGQGIVCSDDANHVFITSSGNNTNVGAMWYYARTVVGVTCTWAQSGSVIVPSDSGATATPRIGSAIACDSNATYITLAGCPVTAINPVVWFYKRVDTTVSQLATGFTLTGLAAAAGTFVSASMSADGNYAAFGVPTDNTNFGAVYIFTRTANTDTWAQTQIIRSNTSGAGILLYTGMVVTANSFGRGVALSGDGSRLVVGAPNDTNTGATAGATWIFSRTAATWLQLQRVVYTTTAATLAGTSVSIARNGTFGYAGAPGNGTNVGAVFMFSIAPFSNATTTYVARAALAPSGNGATPNYGNCIAMSSDGGNAIVGGPNETNTGAQAGCIYIIGGSGGCIQSTEQFRSLYTSIPASVNYGIAFDGNSSGLYWKYNSTAFTYRPAISHRGFEVVNFSSANTVTNPLLSFNNDLSGVYMPTTTTLAFNLASSERLRLTDADGLTNSRIITQVSRVPDSGTASASNASVRATFSILGGQFNEVSWSPGLATTGFTQTPSGSVSTAVSTIPYVFNGTPATGQTLIFTTPSLAVGVYRISYNTLYTSDSAIVVLRFQQSAGADVDIRTYDAYSATSAVVSYVSYMTITTAGVATVKWFTNSKNGSSSGFLMNVSSLRLELLQ